MKRIFANRWIKTIFIILIVFGVGPFLIPVPKLAGTQPAKSLADPDSQFIEINGLELHVKTFGDGEPAFLLLHGFGASLYSWNSVIGTLSEQGKVIVYDRPAFGLSERPLTWDGQNPYSSETQNELVLGLLDYYKLENAILIGNSAGGTIAMQFALAYPERVSALILVDPAVYGQAGAPKWIRPLLSIPQIDRLGPLFVRKLLENGTSMVESAWNDSSKITTETIKLYKKPLLVDNWDRALWEFTLASTSSNLKNELDQFALPILVITGDNDQIVPTTDSIRLADALPNATLVVIKNAGHVPHEEQTQDFLNAVQDFLANNF
jgi:pimeloyl-ACP methyl ester carboxylesterase